MNSSLCSAGHTSISVHSRVQLPGLCAGGPIVIEEQGLGQQPSHYTDITVQLLALPGTLLIALGVNGVACVGTDIVFSSSAFNQVPPGHCRGCSDEARVDCPARVCEANMPLSLRRSGLSLCLENRFFEWHC